jgi:hypothetical protein
MNEMKLNIETLEGRLVPATLSFVDSPLGYRGQINQTEKIAVRWSDPVVDFDINDISFTKNGKPLGKGLTNVIPNGNGKDFTIIGLLNIASGPGDYSLTIDQAGVKEEISDQLFIPAGNCDYTLTWKQMSGSVESFGADWYNFGVLKVPSTAKLDTVSVVSGANHGLALRANGSIVTWGIKESNLQTPPVKFDPTNPFVQVAASWGGSAVLRKDGSVSIWGSFWGTFGSSNVNKTFYTNDVVSISIQSNLLMLHRDGSVTSIDLDPSYKATLPVKITNAIDVSAGRELHSILRADGTVYSWGYSKVHTELLTSGKSFGYIVDVACGTNNIMFKTDRGVTRILGQTDYLCESFNQLGSSVFRPRKLVANSNFASLIDNNGNLVGTFNNWKNYSKSMNVLDSSNGWTHSFVVLGMTKRLPLSWMPRLTVTTNP